MSNKSHNLESVISVEKVNENTFKPIYTNPTNGKKLPIRFMMANETITDYDMVFDEAESAEAWVSTLAIVWEDPSGQYAVADSEF
jgi:hypothetical protein